MNEIVRKDSLNDVQLLMDDIKDKHKRVSSISTPKKFVMKKQGMDYTGLGYMKYIADKEYTGWSWEILKTEAIGTEAWLVHGRLKYYDCGIWRTGDMVAAHRIQTKRGSDGSYVDIGNDIKAANTDCMKKAFNVYLNVADDVYKNLIETDLSDKEKEVITKMAVNTKYNDDILEKIKDGIINKSNYKSSIAKLKRLIGDKGDKNET